MEALYFNAKDGFLGECPLAKIAPFDLYFLTTAAFSARTRALLVPTTGTKRNTQRPSCEGSCPSC